MPTYDYGCCRCSLEFESFQHIATRNSQKCIRCGSKRIERIFYASNVKTFKPHWDTNIDRTPVYFDSQRQLDNYMKKMQVRVFEKGEKYRKMPERKKFDGIEVKYGPTMKGTFKDGEFVKI